MEGRREEKGSRKELVRTLETDKEGLKSIPIRNRGDSAGKSLREHR